MEALNARAPTPRAYTTDMPRLDRESYLEQRAQAEVQQLLAEYGDHALVNFARAMQTLDPARVRALCRLAARD